MLSLGQSNTVSWRLFIRVGGVFILLALLSPWLLPSRYVQPLTSSAKANLFGNGNVNSGGEHDETLYSPSISPFENELPPFEDVLKLQLPPHAAQRWALIHKVFTHYNPGNPLSTNTENADKKEYYAERWETCERPNLISLDAKSVSKAKKNHAGFIKRLPALARAFTYPAKTHGIVTTADGEMMPILLVSLRMLRRTGCTLPVEVFISNFADYEPKLCEKVLPSLNAKCVLFASDFMDTPAPEGTQPITTYQIKPFTLLLSSFNEVLFLDADSFPITDPSLLFASRPFIDTGLVIWPDFWCASQSKYFYQITGIPEAHIHDRPSSESGQMLYDKNRHIQDLLLACYYGYYGPGLWYSLLSQGFPGEGDKETYIAAAMVMNASFYQPRQLPGMLPDEGRDDFAIQQVNPQDDYAAMLDGEAWQDLQLPHAFIHHHHPKLNALSIMESDYDWIKESHARMWGNTAKNLYGLDLEFEVWKAINYTACDLGHMIRAWEGKSPTCNFVQEHMRQVFKTPY